MRERPAAFLDRDGTITVERGYLRCPEDIEMIPGSAAGIRMLRDAGLLVVVVSNQSGVARGLMTEEDVALVHEALERLLGREGATIDGAYYCPNYSEGTDERYTRDTSCRKPAPGMIERAVRDLGIDLRSSVMVGDQLSDLELAAGVGIPGVLVLTGKGREAAALARDLDVPIAHTASDLAEAAAWIIAQARSGRPGG
jgi:D-glycero-D-manno-heptose 1,7-bisphosphate phosphatase